MNFSVRIVTPEQFARWRAKFTMSAIARARRDTGSAQRYPQLAHHDRSQAHRHLVYGDELVLLRRRGGARDGHPHATRAPRERLSSPRTRTHSSLPCTATAMIFLFVAPFALGLANFLIPLQIGAPDMAFPRLNATSYWLFLFGGLTIFSGAATNEGAAAAGWTAYAPLSDDTRRHRARPGSLDRRRLPRLASRRSSRRSISSRRPSSIARPA